MLCNSVWIPEPRSPSNISNRQWNAWPTLKFKTKMWCEEDGKFSSSWTHQCNPSWLGDSLRWRAVWRTIPGRTGCIVLLPRCPSGWWRPLVPPSQPSKRFQPALGRSRQCHHSKTFLTARRWQLSSCRVTFLFVSPLRVIGVPDFSVCLCQRRESKSQKLNKRRSHKCLNEKNSF